MQSSTGSNAPPPTAVQQQAAAVAAALIDELRFAITPGTGWSQKWKDQLCDSEQKIKNAMEWTEQSGAHTDMKHIPKVHLASDIADKITIRAGKVILEDCESLFCVSHLGFVSPSSTDIEHSVPSKEILANQKRFLAFLNTNQAFADAFLNETGMSDYFKRGANGQIFGTTYFYKLCYNSIDNLWLICHGCNDKKATKDEREWFKNQKWFGQSFLNHLQNKGDVNSGVILRIVGGQPIAALNMNGEQVNIHAHGVGIGKFARDWFLNEHKTEFDTHKDYYVKNYGVVKNKLENIRALRLQGEHKKAKNAFFF